MYQEEEKDMAACRDKMLYYERFDEKMN